MKKTEAENQKASLEGGPSGLLYNWLFFWVNFFLKCCVPTSNLVTAVNHLIFYCTLWNPGGWSSLQHCRGACPHAHAHPLYWLHICWLLLLLDWLLGSFLPFHFIVLLWTYPGGSHLAGLKASAALGPLGCPSSVYSAVKFAVSPTPSLTAKPVTSTCESEGAQAFGVIYKHIPEADKTSAGPQKDCCGVR